MVPEKPAAPIRRQAPLCSIIRKKAPLPDRQRSLFGSDKHFERQLSGMQGYFPRCRKRKVTI